MISDEDKFNAFVALSDKDLKQPSFESWFSRAHQKVHIFNLARELFVRYNDELNAEEAILEAEEFINTFYNMKVNKHTRK